MLDGQRDGTAAGSQVEDGARGGILIQDVQGPGDQCLCIRARHQHSAVNPEVDAVKLTMTDDVGQGFP